MFKIKMVPLIHVYILKRFSFSEKNQYANIRHSFDIWHGTENLGKKIIKVRMFKLFWNESVSIVKSVIIPLKSWYNNITFKK